MTAQPGEVEQLITTLKTIVQNRTSSEVVRRPARLAATRQATVAKPEE